jgi:hypothetical protein
VGVHYQKAHEWEEVTATEGVTGLSQEVMGLPQRVMATEGVMRKGDEKGLLKSEPAGALSTHPAIRH